MDYCTWMLEKEYRRGSRHVVRRGLRRSLMEDQKVVKRSGCWRIGIGLLFHILNGVIAVFGLTLDWPEDDSGY